MAWTSGHKKMWAALQSVSVFITSWQPYQLTQVWPHTHSASVCLSISVTSCLFWFHLTPNEILNLYVCYSSWFLACALTLEILTSRFETSTAESGFPNSHSSMIFKSRGFLWFLADIKEALRKISASGQLGFHVSKPKSVQLFQIVGSESSAKIWIGSHKHLFWECLPASNYIRMMEERGNNLPLSRVHIFRYNILSHHQCSMLFTGQSQRLLEMLRCSCVHRCHQF